MKRWVVLVLLTLAGCGTDPPEIETTELLATNELVFAVSAEGNGEAVLVAATLSSTRAGAHVLADGDRLVASAEDAAGQTLSRYDTSGYAALLPTTAARVTLSLVRPSEQVSADIDLPPPFTLTVPSGTVSATAAMPLSWDAADTGDAMTLEVSGPCVAPLSRSLASDTGSYEMQPGDLAFHEPGHVGCTLAVSLVRSRASAPLGLAGSNSNVRSAQVRTSALEVTQ